MIILYNILGPRVPTLVDSWHGPRRHGVAHDGLAFPHGVYFYRLTDSTTQQVRALTIAQ